MRIIVEGVDKSGKSTLIEKMKNQFEYAIAIKNMIKPRDKSQYETSRITEIYDEITSLSGYSDETIYILDRFYQSEIVYSALRGNDRFDDEDFMDWVEDLESEIKENTLLVLVETDAETVAKRFKTCGEDFAKEEQIGMLQERYNRVLEQTKLRHIKLDTTKLGIEKSLKLIKEELNKFGNYR